MKKGWMVSLMTVVMAVSMTACGKSSGDGTESTDSNTPAETTTVGAGASGETQTADAGEPVGGGVLTISLSSSSKSPDPVKYTGTYESQIIGSVCDTLAEYSSSLIEIMPSIAASWEVSDGGKECTFKLRDDVYFQPGQYQDGRQVTAEDIKYPLERSHELSTTNRLNMLDHCEVINDTGVECVLEDPNTAFLTVLTDAGNVIIPREEVERQGDDFGTHLMEGGPFASKKFGLDQQAILVRNERYWAQEPHLNGVAFRPVNGGNQAVNTLRTGRVNVTASLTGEAVQVAGDDDTVKLLEMPGLHISYLYFNVVDGPTKDPKIHETLIRAVNMEELAGDMYQYSGAVPASLPLPPGPWGYDEAVKTEVPTYDPEAARALLAEAGCPGGFDLNLYTFNTPTKIKTATLFQAYLQQNLNMSVNINTSEWGTFSEIGASEQADVFDMSWAWYPDPYFFLSKLFYSGGIGSLGNGQGYNDPEVDKCLESTLLTTDQNECTGLYKKTLALIVKDMPGIFYTNENVEWGMTPNVQGLVQRTDSKVETCTADINVWLSE